MEDLITGAAQHFLTNHRHRHRIMSLKKKTHKELTSYSLFSKGGLIFFFNRKQFLINLYKADPHENNWVLSHQGTL